MPLLALGLMLGRDLQAPAVGEGANVTAAVVEDEELPLAIRVDAIKGGERHRFARGGSRSRKDGLYEGVGVDPGR
jgi:hypothetical protein